MTGTRKQNTIEASHVPDHRTLKAFSRHLYQGTANLRVAPPGLQHFSCGLRYRADVLMFQLSRHGM